MKAKRLIEKALAHKDFVQALYKGSYQNKEYAKARLATFAKVLENQEVFESTQGTRLFSMLTPGTSVTSRTPGYGVVLQLASLLANVSSFSGFLTIEKAMDQPTMVFQFLDIIGTNVRDRGAQTPRFPAVGPTLYDNSSLAMQNEQVELTVNQTNLTVTIDTDIFSDVAGIPRPPSGSGIPRAPLPPILPCSIRIILTVPNNPNYPGAEIVVDNCSGGWTELTVAPSSWISIDVTASNLDYGNPNTGTPASLALVLNINVPSGATAPSTVIAQISFAFNYVDKVTYPGEEQDNRFIFDLTRNVRIESKPNVLTFEMNRQELAAISKSFGQDLQPVLVQRVTDIYNKYINRYIVRKFIQRFWNHRTAVVLDVGSPIGGPLATGITPTASFDQYIPILDRLRGTFERVRQALREKSYVANKITALLVSPKLSSWLARSIMVEQSLFAEEEVSYINDLFGYYLGIPVLVHTELTAIENAYETWARGTGNPMASSGNHVTAAVGMAVAVLPDNNMAPAARGIFLPMTHTPTVANFNNPIQEAFSVYFMEETEELARELVVPFAVVNLPVS